eukprot:gene1718-3327_t
MISLLRLALVISIGTLSTGFLCRNARWTVVMKMRDSSSEIMPLSTRDDIRRSVAATFPLILSVLSLPIISNAAQYLVEPTADFKAEELRTAKLREEEAKARKVWDDIVAKLLNSDDPVSLASTIKEMRLYLIKIDGVPSGFKKQDIIKLCRSKKFISGRKIKPTWTTPVEIEYQAFVKEINRQLSPEKPGKDLVF